jgi:nucleoside-diphosphate-sugar epimerase
MKHVLLIGATGHVGAAIMDALNERGTAVTALTRRAEKLHGSKAQILEITEGQDVNIALSALPETIDAVILAAGRASLSPAQEQEALSVDTALVTPYAAWAHQRATPFALVSSIRARAGVSSVVPITESTPHAPCDAYGRLKLAVEEAVLTHHPHALILQSAPHYGVGAKGYLASLTRLALTPYPLPVKGLSAPRSVIATPNFADATLFLMAQGIEGRVLVAEKEPTSIEEWVRATRRLNHKPERLLPAPLALLRALHKLIPHPVLERAINPLVIVPGALNKLAWTEEKQRDKEIKELILSIQRE